MNFKRVLVLVMALVMMMSVCAPSVLAATKSETKHEHLENVLDNPELAEKYEEIKATVELVAKDIEENHEEYYANGYAYADENGYIDTAIEVIKVMLDTLPEIDLDGVGMTDELREKLEVELDALVPTLEKLLAILESGEASDFDGFVNAALTLEGDLYTHLNNMYAILEQGSIDLNQFVLVPAFNEALRLLNEEVLPAIDAAINAFVDGVVDYVVDTFGPYYEQVVSVIGIARDVFDALVETIVKIDLFVGGVSDAVIGAYNSILGALLEVYGDVESVYQAIESTINAVVDIYNGIINAIRELNAKVENTIDNIEQIICKTVNAYKYTVSLLVGVYGEVKNALIVASQLHDYIIYSIPAIVDGLVDFAEYSADFALEIIEILNNAYDNKDNIESVASAITAHLTKVAFDIVGIIFDTIDGAVNGSYELTDDSYYVAIGEADYADALAGKLNLSEKYEVISLSESNFDKLANADLITLKLDNGSFMSLAETQVEGKVVEIVKDSDLYPWYEAIPNLIETANKFADWGVLDPEARDEYVGAINTAKLIIDSFIDFDSTVEELDWDKYLDAEGQAALDAFLIQVREQLLKEGVEEYTYFDIRPLIHQTAVGSLLDGINPIAIPQVDLIVFALENMLYGYAEYIDNLTTVLANAPADATVVLTGVENPLVGYSFKGFDLSSYASVADPLVDVLNAHLYAFALANENVVFVPTQNADDIYNALNVYCKHITSTCTDTECDRCLATVDPMGHDFDNYEFQASTSCKKDGVEVGTCTRCGETDTRTVPDTKGEHDLADATCTSPAKCKVCGKKFGEPIDHELGEWRRTKDPTSNSEGMEERKCLHCEYKITRAIPFDSLSTIAVVAIIVCCIAGVGAISAAVAGFLRKKNKI